jgi:hypothetical protein
VIPTLHGAFRKRLETQDRLVHLYFHSTESKPVKTESSGAKGRI